MMKLSLLFMPLFFWACSQGEGTPAKPISAFITSSADKSRSTVMGNFTATAVKQAYDLDFVFLPARYYQDRDVFFEVTPNMSPLEIDQVLEHYPRNPQDQILIGSLSGRHIKRFLISRSEESYNVDLEVAGLWYHVHFNGGVVEFANTTIQGRMPIDDDQIYRVAISDDFFFGSAFPGYKFRNNFNFHFTRERLQQSIREGVRKFLSSSDSQFRDWALPRARVTEEVRSHLGFRDISKIQGRGHASPLRAHTVVTRGVVTAVGSDPWYPFDLDIYIQSQTPDSDPLTSEGLHITSQFNNVKLELGQVIEVRGIVIEEMRSNGMGETTLRLTEPPKVIQASKRVKVMVDNKEIEQPVLPKALGLSRIPTEKISNFYGPLMQKNELDLTDGIDFWESVEGMRIQVSDLVVAGFRGGGEELLAISDRFYLNLYVYSKRAFTPHLRTAKNGLMPDIVNDDFNPELFVITTNHLSRGIQVIRNRSRDEYYMYNVGDEIAHSGQILEGVMTYPRNLFGGGEYAMVLPVAQEAMVYDNIKTEGFVPFEDRPITRLESGDDPHTITAATFNLENLAGNRPDRIAKLAEVVETNLKCPDLINLVEIQDNNGTSLRAGAGAGITLKRVKVAIQERCIRAHYEYVNIDPFEQAEGGQPGGNIRISILYNQEKLGFEYRGTYKPLEGGHTGVMPGGALSLNPGRVFPLDPIFGRSRRSPVMEFYLRAKPTEKLYFIGAHLNSKLGDTDVWGSEQPVAQLSDDLRALRLSC